VPYFFHDSRHDSIYGVYGREIKWKKKRNAVKNISQTSFTHNSEDAISRLGVTLLSANNLITHRRSK